jgi:amino acid adenylation domain-containing protein
VSKTLQHSGPTAADREDPPRFPVLGVGTRVPRWTAPGATSTEPVEGLLVLGTEPVAALRAAAAAAAVSLDAVLLAAHLRVLAVLSADRAPVTGQVPPNGDPAAPRPVGIELLPGSWRELVRRVARASRDPLHGGASPTEGYETVLDLSELHTARGAAGEQGPLAEAALWVKVTGHGDQLMLRAVSRTDVMTADQLSRIAGYHRTALELLARDLDAPHHRQSLLSEQERHFQIEELSGERLPLDASSFVARFEEQVRAHPNTVAASHRNRSWSYRTLNRHANRIARGLLDRGLAAEDVVAVELDRGLPWMASTIGVLKAGGTYLPVQPQSPAPRTTAQIERSDCRFVLGDGDGPCADGRRHGRPLLVASDYCGPGEDPGDPGIPIAPDQLAYIYFTSGSTGAPKGVMCEHGGLLNHLLMKVEDMELGAGQVVAQTSPQSLDVSLWQLIAPLLVGGGVRIVDTEVLLEVDRFLEEITAHRVRVAQLAPSYFDALVTRLESRPRDLGALRSVSVTGEVLRKSLVRRWFACQPAIRLVNAYGATELCDDTMHEVLDRAPEREFVSIGRMRRNVYGYVLDENGALAPLGSPGELAFSGVAVGRGYVGDPERTRQAFVADPHRPGARMYRTGDFGRWLPEGRIEFLGRRDQQVKIRGFRVETAEVENQLLAMPAVRDAAVVLTSAGGERHQALAAFLVGVERLSSESVAQFLSAYLPDYMVPTYVHQLESLPLNRSAKVDRKALTDLAGTLGHGDGPHNAPRTTTERRLAMAWAEVLNVPLQQIGRADSFFDLGATSLSATWLVVRLDRMVSLAQILCHPVLSDLAAAVDAAAASAGTAAVPAAPARLLRRLSPVGPGSAGALLCFPYAAGNAVNFHAIAQELVRDRVAVYGVELPGHDFTPGRVELLGVGEVARRVRDELVELGEVPVLVWGQGEGAAHALALTRLLEDGRTAPRRVILGGFVLDSAERLRAQMERVQRMSNQEVAGALHRAGAYVEFDGLKAERAELVGAAYRHDVRSAGDYLLAARGEPEVHRIRAGIDLVVATGTPAATRRHRLHRDWEQLCGDVRMRELSGSGPYLTSTRATDARALVLAALT